MKVMEAISVSATSASSAPSEVAKLLCNSQLELQELLSASRMCFLALDAEGRICEWSTPLATLIGFTKFDMCGSKFLDLVTSDVHNVVRDVVDKALTLYHWKSISTQLSTKYSNQKDVMLHAIPYGFNDRLYIVVQPTSLEDCHPHGLSIDVGIPAFDLDASNNISVWNSRMSVFSGFTEDDVMGLSLFDLLEPETLPDVQCMLARSQEDADPSTCSVCFYTLTGVPKEVQLSAVAVRDTDGQVVGTSIVLSCMVEDRESSTLQLPGEVSESDFVDDMLSFTSEESDAEL